MLACGSGAKKHALGRGRQPGSTLTLPAAPPVLRTDPARPPSTRSPICAAKSGRRRRSCARRLAWQRSTCSSEHRQRGGSWSRGEPAAFAGWRPGLSAACLLPSRVPCCCPAGLPTHCSVSLRAASTSSSYSCRVSGHALPTCAARHSGAKLCGRLAAPRRGPAALQLPAPSRCPSRQQASCTPPGALHSPHSRVVELEGRVALVPPVGEGQPVAGEGGVDAQKVLERAHQALPRVLRSDRLVLRGCGARGKGSSVRATAQSADERRKAGQHSVHTDHAAAPLAKRPAALACTRRSCSRGNTAIQPRSLSE